MIIPLCGVLLYVAWATFAMRQYPPCYSEVIDGSILVAIILSGTWMAILVIESVSCFCVTHLLDKRELCTRVFGECAHW